MVSVDEDNRIAFMTCIEVALMKQGNTSYNLVLAKLNARYGCGIHECVDHQEYLKTVMKEVYEGNYNDVLDAISLETDKLENMDEFKANFFKFMMS
ncbi:hypothetical protein [Candidatus Nitrosotalea bavarica]|uniref:hypothetical protein n=1 Tax=Candidatus Nitrosotalea bavarica TaxID=1903277 RepID=UPI001056BEA8|nr:hypothetical protein [Candidatus Nitrosotalea bavarica]